MIKNLKLPKEQVFCGGILNVVIPSLASFMKAIKDNDNFKGWIFRGQYCPQWELRTSLQRSLHKNQMNFGTKHLERFKTYARGLLRYDQFMYSNEDELWAIGQHYGLKTPLLDWTASPFVALYFAFEEEDALVKIKKMPLDNKILEYLEKNKKKPDDFRTVYFFNASKVKTMFHKIIGAELIRLDNNLIHQGQTANDAKKIGISPEEFVGRHIYYVVNNQSIPHNNKYYNMKEAYLLGEMTFINVVSPSSGENKRLLSQRGLFTKTYSKYSIDQIIKKEYKDDNFLIKAFIPNSLRQEIISFLDTVNINHLSLFPDLYGAAMYSNTKLNQMSMDNMSNILEDGMPRLF
jgi:hypothetical protein